MKEPGLQKTKSKGYKTINKNKNKTKKKQTVASPSSRWCQKAHLWDLTLLTSGFYFSWDVYNVDSHVFIHYTKQVPLCDYTWRSRKEMHVRKIIIYWAHSVFLVDPFLVLEQLLDFLSARIHGDVEPLGQAGWVSPCPSFLLWKLWMTKSQHFCKH